jgi:hypothetical protein
VFCTINMLSDESDLTIMPKGHALPEVRLGLLTTVYELLTMLARSWKQVDKSRLPLELMQRVISFLPIRHLTPLMRVSRAIQALTALKLYQRVPIEALVHAQDTGGAVQYSHSIEHIDWERLCPCTFRLLRNPQIALPRLHTIRYDTRHLNMGLIMFRHERKFQPRTVIIPVASATSFHNYMVDVIMPSHKYIYLIHWMHDMPDLLPPTFPIRPMANDTGTTESTHVSTTIVFRPGKSLWPTSCLLSRGEIAEWVRIQVTDLLYTAISTIHKSLSTSGCEARFDWLIVGAEQLLVDEHLFREVGSDKCQAALTHFRDEIWNKEIAKLRSSPEALASHLDIAATDAASAIKTLTRIESIRWKTLRDYVDCELDVRDISKEEAESWFL